MFPCQLVDKTSNRTTRSTWVVVLVLSFRSLFDCVYVGYHGLMGQAWVSRVGGTRPPRPLRGVQCCCVTVVEVCNVVLLLL